MRTPPLGVRQRESAHEVREIPIAIQPQHQMPVIRHQAVRQDAHGNALGPGQHPLERGVIAVLVKERLPAIRAIEHVIDQVARRRAERTSHPDAHGLMANSDMVLYPRKWFLTPFPFTFSVLLLRDVGDQDLSDRLIWLHTYKHIESGNS